jgi:hypothetical protein
MVVKLTTLYKKYFLMLCMIVGCWIIPGKAHAFDYKVYSKEMRQIRSVNSAATTFKRENESSTGVKEKKSKSKAFKVIVSKLLEALDSDMVPAKMFKANQQFSIYLKPARVTKFGIKYKF